MCPASLQAPSLPWDRESQALGCEHRDFWARQSEHLRGRGRAEAGREDAARDLNEQGRRAGGSDGVCPSAQCGKALSFQPQRRCQPC